MTPCDYEEVIILYEDEDYFDIIPPLKKKTTSPQMQSSSQQNCTSSEVLTLQDEPESHSQINTPQKTAKDHSDIPRIGRGNYFPTLMFDDLTPEEELYIGIL